MNGYNDTTISVPSPSHPLGPFPSRQTPVHGQQPQPHPHPHYYHSHLPPPPSQLSSGPPIQSAPSFIPPPPSSSASHPYYFAPDTLGFTGHQQTPVPHQISPSHHHPKSQRIYGGTGTGNQLGPYGQQPLSQADHHLPHPHPLPHTTHPHQAQPQQAQYPYGAVTMGFPMPAQTIPAVSGAMMHPTMQGQMTVHQSPYTGAPYARVVNPSPSRPPSFSSSQSPLPQQIYTPPHQSSVQGVYTPIQSPSQQASPRPPQQPLPQHQQPSSQQPPPMQGYPQAQSSQQQEQQQQQEHMFAPGSTSLPPTSQPSQSSFPPGNIPQGVRRASISQPPLSPSSREREKERISLLLLINGELLKELLRLQTEGKGAGIQSQSPKEETGKEDRDGIITDSQVSTPPKPVTPHPTYVECMRCLQANLAYLAAVADRAHKPTSTIPPCPTIMTGPKSLTSISELYRKLAALFPERSSSSSTNQQQSAMRTSVPPPPSSSSSGISAVAPVMENGNSYQWEGGGGGAGGQMQMQMPIQMSMLQQQQQQQQLHPQPPPLHPTFSSSQPYQL